MSGFSTIWVPGPHLVLPKREAVGATCKTGINSLLCDLRDACFGHTDMEVLYNWRCKGEKGVRKVQPGTQLRFLEEAEHAIRLWSVSGQSFKSVSQKELFRGILALQSLGLWKSWVFTVLSVVKVVRTYAMSQDALSAEKSNHGPFEFLRLGKNMALNTSVHPSPIPKAAVTAAKLTLHQQAVKINPLSSSFMK